MDKTFLISMFIAFASSNDVLKYEPRQPPNQDLHENRGITAKWTPPKYCNGLDCPEFKVVKSVKNKYEERIYSTSRWVSTNLTGIDYNSAQYTMFMKLFKYISGENAKKQKIDMTCPVTNRIIPGQGPACESDFIMSFFIAPKVVEAPEPTNQDVFLKKVSDLHVYVGQFPGFTPTFESWSSHAAELGKALDEDGLTYEKNYYFTAGYNSPFQLFNRHNEIWFVKK